MTEQELQAVRQRMLVRTRWLPRHFASRTERDMCADDVNQTEDDCAALLAHVDVQAAELKRLREAIRSLSEWECPHNEEYSDCVGEGVKREALAALAQEVNRGE